MVSFWQGHLWQYGLSGKGGHKIRKVFPKNQHNQRKLLNFENWFNGKVSKSAKIGLSKSIFYLKNHQNFLNFVFIGIEYILLTFFDNINFWNPVITKMMPNFSQLAIKPILKIPRYTNSNTIVIYPWYRYSKIFVSLDKSIKFWLQSCF